MLIRVGEVAGNLIDLNRRRIRGIGKGCYLLISSLNLHLTVVQGSSIHAGWGTGLESSRVNADSLQRIL